MIASAHTSKRDYAAEEERQARMILSGTLFILAFLALLFFTIPAFHAMRSAQTRLVALAITASENERLATAFENAHVRLARHSAALKRAQIALPVLHVNDTSDVPVLLATLETLVERDVGGIFLDKLVVGSNAELREGEGDIFWRPMLLSGLAGTGSVTRLLDQIRGVLHLIEPVNLTMTPEGDGVVSFTLEMQRAVLKK